MPYLLASTFYCFALSGSIYPPLPPPPPLGTFMLYIINNFRSLHVFASHLQIIALRVYTSYFASDGESDIDDRRNQKLITLDGAIN